MSIDPIRPYLPLITLGLLILMILGGCSWGKSIQKAKDAEVIAQKNEALLAANASLTAAGRALRAVDAEAKARIERAEEAAKAAQDAGRVAERAEDKARARDREFERRVEVARRDLTCAALLSANIEEVCKL